MFAEAGLSQTIIRLLGGIESTRAIHHVAAVVLMLEAIFHLGTVSYKMLVRRVRLDMLPGLGDVRAAWRALLYNLGLHPRHPQEGRYTFAEKAEYWAVVWGTVVMAVTGFMMWNPISTARLLPGEAIPAAKAAHGFEAILAVLAILIWHMYHVHLRRFNKSMFTGRLSEEEMLEEHPLELADLKAGVASRPVDPRAVARRRRVFLPVFARRGAGACWSVCMPSSPTSRLPSPPCPNRSTCRCSSRSPPPPSHPAPDADTAALRDARADRPGCGSDPYPGVAAGVTWEVRHRSGSSSEVRRLPQQRRASWAGWICRPTPRPWPAEPTVRPWSPATRAGSLLVTRQQAGGHPGQLTPEELEAVIAWILAGAPER